MFEQEGRVISTHHPVRLFDAAQIQPTHHRSKGSAFLIHRQGIPHLCRDAHTGDLVGIDPCFFNDVTGCISNSAPKLIWVLLHPFGIWIGNTISLVGGKQHMTVQVANDCFITSCARIVSKDIAFLHGHGLLPCYFVNIVLK